MKTNTILKYLLVLSIGFNLHNFALSDVPSKIAVVNINQIINHSSQVAQLQKEQSLKNKEIQQWLLNAKADVEKQTTNEAKEKLVKKYDSEFRAKQEKIQKEYTSKLQSIDKDITAIIQKEAKAKGYDIVLSKSVVLYGGEDITKTISSLVK